MNRCLKFKLPSGAAGMASLHRKKQIMDKMHDIAESHDIHYVSQVQVSPEDGGFYLKIWLKAPEDFTAFFLVWDDQYEFPEIKDEEAPINESGV